MPLGTQDILLDGLASDPGSPAEGTVWYNSTDHRLRIQGSTLTDIYHLKTNLAATTAPGVGNDSSQGYAVGSIWVDVTADISYFCLDSTVGAAVWKVSSLVVSSTAPADVTKATAAVGTGTTAARSDHKHDVSTAAPSTLAAGGSNTEGSATSLARSDHVHALPAYGTTSGTFCQGNDSRLSDDRTASGLRSATTVVSISSATAPTLGQVLAATSGTAAAWSTPLGLTSSAPANVTKAAAAVGVGTAAARDDHKHDVTTAAPSTLAAGGSNTEGSATSLARSDHVHALPAYGTASSTICQGNDSRLSDDRTASGFRTATTVVSISGATAPTSGQALIATSSTTATWQTPSGGGAALTTNAPVNVTKATAAVGTGTTAARDDHKHDITTAAPVATGTANAEGTSTSLARADHVHFDGSRINYLMTEVLTPANSDWPLNVFAPLTVDAVNACLSVRYFDAAVNEGIGLGLTIPTGTTSIVFSFKSRARSAPASTLAVVPGVYTRTFGDNASPGAWSAATTMTALSFPTNTNIQYDSQTISLATLSLTAGDFVMFELVRLATNAGDTLTVDWGLVELVLEFI